MTKSKFCSGINSHFRSEKELIRAFLYTDYKIEPHNHEFYEMNIIMNGSGTHLIEDSMIDVKCGDVFVIPPMTVHAYCNTRNLDVYHILLQKRFLFEERQEAIEVPGFLQFTEIEPFLRRNFKKSMFLHLSPHQMLQLKNELEFIDDANFSDEGLIPMKKNATKKIIYWLSFLLSEQQKRLDGNFLNKYESNIITSLDYIHNNFGEKITIEDLCKQTFLSRSTFLRCFNKMCNCTPLQYLNKYRSTKATEMLENSELSKTEIAHKCGFYDLSHMERILKKYT